MVIGYMSWGFKWDAVNPLVESRVNAPGRLGCLTNPRFSVSLSMHNSDLIFSFFITPFLLRLRMTCMVTLPLHNHTLNGNTKWQVIWTYHKCFSKPRAHAFSCRCQFLVLILSHNVLSLNTMKSMGHQTST